MDGVKTAESMLGEVPSESLQQLLTALTLQCELSPAGFTQIPALDLSTTTSPHSYTRPSVNRGDVIEIQGPASSGKTHLLCHLIITCVMPSFYLSTELGGWQKAAAVFDTDGTFSIRRLRTLLLSRLSHMLSLDEDTASGSSLMDELADQALERIHIFRPNSSNQLAATLAQLPTYHAKYLTDCELGLLAIDSISSFYWPDRYTVEQFRSAQVTASDVLEAGGVTPSWSAPLQNVVTVLRRLRVSHGLVTVLTNWGLNPVPKPSSSDPAASATFYRQHLHPFLSHDDFSQQVTTQPPASTSLPNIATKIDSGALTLPLTHHITLPFVAVPPFHQGISIDEAEVEEEKYRNRVVAKGEVTGIVRTQGSNRLGRFIFWISDREVCL